MSKIYLGARLENLDIMEDLAPVSRVTLTVDQDHVYTAGDDTGREIVVTCPWGTPEMAADLLDRAKTIRYHPYSGKRAILDPAFEIGDTVTVGGIQSVIANVDTTYNSAFLSNISAPGIDEVEEEGPYTSVGESIINQKIAYTRSLISKTAEQILLEVEGLDEKISVTVDLVDGLTVKDDDGVVKIKGGMVTAEGLHVNAANIDGTLKADQIELTGSISWPDLATDAQNQVISAQNQSLSAYNLANNANNAAANANNQILYWTYPGTTVIDGNKLMTGTVMASKLLGGTVGLLAYDQQVVGSIDIAYTTTGYGLSMNTSYGGIKIQPAGNFFIQAGGSGGPFLQGMTSGELMLSGQRLLLGAYLYGASLPSSPANGQLFFKLRT